MKAEAMPTWLACAALFGLQCGCEGELALFERDVARAGQAGASDGDTAGQTSGGAGGAAPELLLIDDFEDGDSHAIGPLGWWYPTNDGSGTQGWGIEAVSEPSGSTQALRTHGEGFTDWGALVGVNLEGEALVDASALVVLRLWARVGPDSVQQVSVKVLDADRAGFTRALVLSGNWTEYRMPLGEFRNEAGVAVDTSGLSAIHFVFPPNEAFDLWLDNLALE